MVEGNGSNGYNSKLRGFCVISLDGVGRHDTNYNKVVGLVPTWRQGSLRGVTIFVEGPNKTLGVIEEAGKTGVETKIDEILTCPMGDEGNCSFDCFQIMSEKCRQIWYS